MGVDYSVNTIRKLEGAFRKTNLHRPMAVTRYEAGDELEYRVTGVSDGHEGTIRVKIDQFVGGGFAGQVYRVTVLGIKSKEGQIDGLKVGSKLAMKILIPPSAFSRIFRNILYWIGFQGAFQLQVNPAAMRAGALWQKLIQRGAKVKFGDESCVRDIYATFVDEKMGSCGELSDWIEGRTWRLEVDPYMDVLKRWRGKKRVNPALLGSPEYRAKHEFMHEFVDLLHDMGAHEFARQYEWSTCKSQPNSLKRSSTEKYPEKGLVAVDFRAGLALLPFLPMSPGDFKLIGAGILRGSLVQFDRGDLNKLDVSSRNPFISTVEKIESRIDLSLPDVTEKQYILLFDSDGSKLGLGCGNPLALSSNREGDTVVDLGSGAGFDCFLAAAQVGKNGRVIGVDMTSEMIEKARENAKKGNYGNVEFRLGEIERLPVGDGSVDVIMSNCVINLSPDKGKVF